MRSQPAIIRMAYTDAMRGPDPAATERGENSSAKYVAMLLMAASILVSKIHYKTDRSLKKKELFFFFFSVLPFADTTKVCDKTRVRYATHMNVSSSTTWWCVCILLFVTKVKERHCQIQVEDSMKREVCRINEQHELQ